MKYLEEVSLSRHKLCKLKRRLGRTPAIIPNASTQQFQRKERLHQWC